MTKKFVFGQKDGQTELKQHTPFSLKQEDNSQSTGILLTNVLSYCIVLLFIEPHSFLASDLN